MTRIVKNEELVNSVRKSGARDSKQRLKKKKKKKDLEQLRSKVLAAKKNATRRSLQTKNTFNTTSKNSLEKTLNKFAEFRQKINNKTQGLDSRKLKNTRKKRICERLLPEPAIGIFRNGATSKEVHRTRNDLGNKIDEARLRGDLFKLLNSEETLSPSQVAESNSKEKSNTAKDDKKSQDEWESDPENLQFQTNAIRDSPSSNNRKCFQEASKVVNAEQNVGKRRQTHLNMFKNVQRVNKSKRRLFENDNEEEDCETINHLQIEPLCFSPRTDKPNNKVQIKKLSKSNVDDKIQSINRWGRCPATHYEELCAKIHREYFVNLFKYSNVPDPLLHVKEALSSLYMEAKHQNSDNIANDKYFDDKCPAISSRVPMLNNEIFNSKMRVHQEMKNFIDSKAHKSFIDAEDLEREDLNSHPHCPNRPVFIDNNLPLPSKILDHARKKTFIRGQIVNDDENRNSKNITMIHQSETNMEKNNMWDSTISCTNSCKQNQNNINSSFINCNNEYSPPAGWSAKVENEANFAKNFMRHNIKHMPMILRKSNPQACILFNVDQVESHEINNKKNNRKPMFPHERIKSPEQSQRHVTFQNDKYMETPTTIVRMVNNRKEENYLFKLNPNKAKNKFNSSDQIPNQNVIEESKKKREFIENMKIKQTVDSRKKSHTDNEAVYNHKLLPDYVFMKSYDVNQKQNFEKIKVDKHKNKNKINYTDEKYSNQVKQFPYRSQADFNAIFQSNINEPFFQIDREFLSCNEPQGFRKANANQSFHYSSQPQVPYGRSINQKQEAVPPTWGASNYIHYHQNPEMSFIPMNNQNEMKNYENINPTDIEMNDTVLQNFKVLSFEQDQCLEPKTNNCQTKYYMDNPLNLEHALSFTQPSKYRAVIEENENHQLPQRVPIYSEVENHIKPLYNQPICKKTSCQQLLTYQEHQNTHKAIQSGVPVVVFTEKEKKPTLLGRFYSHHKVPKNLHPIPIRNCHDGTDENCGQNVVPADSILAVKSNIQGDKPFCLNNSNAYEIQLADGRIGLLVSK